MDLNIDKSKWKKVKLGEVASEYSSRINNPNESEFDRFVGSSNIGQWDFRVQNWEPTDSVTSAMKLFEPNDYLLVRRSLYASDFRERAPRAHFSGVCSGDILTIKEDPDKIADGFLIGIFNSPALWKYVVANASGSITRRIKWKDLANYEFLLPPKAEQARLAELLWAMDEVIEREVNLDYKLFDLKQSQLKEVFSKNNCDRYKIGDISENLDNKRKPVSKNKRIAGDTPYYGASGIVDYVAGFTHNEAILLISEDGENLNSRNLPIAYSVDGESWINNHSHALRVDKASRYLVQEYFNFSDISDFITGGTRPKVTKGMLTDMPIYLPKSDNEEKCEKKLISLDNAIKSNNKKSASSKSLQKSIINQIF